MLQSTANFVRISFRREDFRIAIARPFGLVALGALAASELFHMLPGTTSMQTLMVDIPVADVILCSLILLAMFLFYRLEIGPEGIGCYDLWLRPHRANWSSITGARLCRRFGLEYLQVTLRDRKRAIWIPLFVTRDSLFRELLITYAGAAHQLDQKFENAI